MKIWTIVQHSGHDTDPGLTQAVEPRSATPDQVRRINQVGGILFESNWDAEEYCLRANYPEGHDVLIPRARGTFSDFTIDGLAVYIPETG